MVEREPIAISKVGINDLGVLLPLLRAYCDFYEVAPRDDRLVSLCRGLIEDPGEGVQLIARDRGIVIGFATIFWTFSTLVASRIGVMNDLYVDPEARGRGVGAALIEACRGECRKRGAAKLSWDTAPDNATAQRLYERTGAERSSWISYELDAW